MELVDQFSGALKRITAMLDMTTSGNPADAVNTLRAELTRLQGEIIDLQQEVLALKNQNMELKDRLRQSEEFDAERHLYQREVLSTGSVVYTTKDTGAGGGKPAGYLCAQCFERRQRSYLQPPQQREAHQDSFTCPVCDYRVMVPNDINAESFTVGTRSGWDDYV